MAFDPISARNDPPKSYVGVTPDDATVLRGYQWIFVGGDGDLVLQGENDAASATLTVTAGQVIPFGAGTVLETTTATGLVAIG